MDFGNLTANQLAKLIQFAQADEEHVDGAQLHAEKNAPWVNGIYSHLRFPSYTFQPFPKMLYSPGYQRAAAQYAGALKMRAKRGDDEDREYLIAQARDARDACTRIVQHEEEQAALGSLWCEHPDQAVAAQETFDRAIAQAAAESNFDDRHLGALATRERTAADDASDGHLVEVAATAIPTYQKKRKD